MCSALHMTLWHSTGWSKRLSWARRRINTLLQRCTTKNLVFMHSDKTIYPNHSGTSGLIQRWTSEKQLAWPNNTRYFWSMWRRSYTLKPSPHWRRQNRQSHVRTPKSASFSTLSWVREAPNMEIWRWTCRITSPLGTTDTPRTANRLCTSLTSTSRQLCKGRRSPK